MIVSMIALNEARMVDPVIGDIHDEPWVDRIIVIDGGSQDSTVQKLKRWPKCEVFHHYYDREYHDAQSMQRNIAMSYVPHGEPYFFLDFDEKCSDELKALLADINAHGMPDDADMVCVSRKSFESMRHEDSPFALLDDHGFPVPSYQIGQYPDWQGRIIRRKPGMFFINSPHHVLVGAEVIVNREADIIHYHGKYDARQREDIEIMWAMTQGRRKRLGLTADVFEVQLKPEYAEYGA
jgi:glycosyltransferase involved in cell wall biosynthesis